MKKYFIIFIAGLIAFGVYFLVKVNKPHDNVFGEKKIKIEKGEGVNDIASGLFDAGFVSNKFWFKLYVGLSGKKNKFYDGEYALRTDLNIRELVRALTESKNSNKETDITLLEGWTVEQIDDYLVSKKLIEPDALIKYVKNYDEKGYFFLIDRPKKATLEGYLYPDTYRVYQQTTVEQIVKKTLDNFDDKLTGDLRQEIKKQKKTIFETITLASIVEKEMFGYENRRVVADIFLKRLKVGMALQSDATVNYVTKKGLAQPTFDDLKVDSLYNTYKYPGLPPGPISNPSIEAITAAVYPKQTDYWYFLTTPDNKIIFSRTLNEHNANKRKYLSNKN